MVLDAGVDHRSLRTAPDEPVEGVVDEEASSTETLCCGMHGEALEVALPAGTAGDREPDRLTAPSPSLVAAPRCVSDDPTPRLWRRSRDLLERCSVVLPSGGETRFVDRCGCLEVSRSKPFGHESDWGSDVDTIVECALEQREPIRFDETGASKRFGGSREQRAGSDSGERARFEGRANPGFDGLTGRLHVDVEQHEVGDRWIERPGANLCAGSRVQDRLAHFAEDTAWPSRRRGTWLLVARRNVTRRTGRRPIRSQE